MVKLFLALALIGLCSCSVWRCGGSHYVKENGHLYELYDEFKGFKPVGVHRKHSDDCEGCKRQRGF